MEIKLAVIGIIITTIGVFVAIIALPWLKGPVEKLFNKMRIKISIWKTKRDGIPNELTKAKIIKYGLAEHYTEDFMFCDWRHEVKVNANGDSEPSIECELVNVSEEVQTEIHFPIYIKFNYKNHLEDFQVWIKIGTSLNNTILNDWDSKKNIGIVKIVFPYPLKPRDNLKIKWGYHCNAVYDGPGQHWFEWYIARPHSYFRVKYSFDNQWIVSNVVGSVVGKTEDTKQPLHKGNQITWFIRAPRPGYKYHLSWILEKR
jgi:hypothetical protein